MSAVLTAMDLGTAIFAEFRLLAMLEDLHVVTVAFALFLGLEDLRETTITTKEQEMK